MGSDIHRSFIVLARSSHNDDGSFYLFLQKQQLDIIQTRVRHNSKQNISLIMDNNLSCSNMGNHTPAQGHGSAPGEEKGLYLTLQECGLLQGRVLL